MYDFLSPIRMKYYKWEYLKLQAQDLIMKNTQVACFGVISWGVF